MSDARKAVLFAGAALLAYLYSQQSGSPVDSPDGTDVFGSVIGTVGGLFSMSATTYSSAAVALVQQVEGCSLTAYPDANGYSIGYGHFGASAGDVITQEQANAYLDADLTTAANIVNNAVNVDISQSMFDAMTSFCYNVGGGHFASSTLLKLVNAGDFAGAQAQFSRWIYSQGQAVPALETRRTLEASLFAQDGFGVSDGSVVA